jgi:hypothetical protein
MKQAAYFQREHHIDSSKYVFYFIPICIIFICLSLHIGFSAVVIIQLLCNALATMALYKTANTVFNNKPQSVFATLLFITFIPIQYWNSFLYTESLFYSLCIFFMYSFVVLPPAKKATHVIRLIIVLALLFTRPLGILFLPVAAWYYLSQSNLLSITKWLVAIAACAIALVLVNFLYQGGADMDIVMPQKQGFIICYGCSITQAGLQTITTGNPLNNLVYFIVHNPGYFLQLAFYRLLYFFTLYRPYYSLLHNAYLIACMVFLYGFAVISAFSTKLIKTVPFKHIFLPLLVIFCVGVMLQCDDFNSRFVMPLFPWIILLAANGAFKTAGRFIKK